MKIINFLSFVYLILLSGCVTNHKQTAPNQANEAPKKIEKKVSTSNKKINSINTEDQLINLLHSNNKKIVLFFFMNGCGWCDMMKPRVQELANKYPDISFYSMNGLKLKAHIHLKEAFNIKVQAYPFFMFMDNNKIINQHLGGMSTEKFEKFIQELI